MAENKHYGKQIFLSLLFTVLVLGILVFGFSTYLLPKYNITKEQIYSVMIKLFPVLVGLVMIQIGAMIAHNNDEHYADMVDKLPPNAYDRPLHSMPCDDPNRLAHQGMPMAEPTVPPQVSVVASAKPVIIEGSEPIVAPTVMVPAVETIDTSFESIFDSELKAAQEFDYDITLVLFKASEDVRADMYGKIGNLVGVSAYAFTLDDDYEVILLPFYNNEEARDYMMALIEQLKQDFEGSDINMGIASRSGRILDTEMLLHEAKNACGNCL